MDRSAGGHRSASGDGSAALRAAERRIARLSEYRRQLRDLTSELALAEERERRRIARGLHDEVGQVLGVVKIKLGELLDDAGLGDRAVRRVEEVRQHVEGMIRKIRSLTFELSSPVLHELGLEAAVQGLADRVAERHGIRCRLIDDARPKPLDADARVVLYSIVRELLWNVVQHSRARRVEIKLARAGDHVRIVVSDDGHGFEVASASEFFTADGGFGLFSARERSMHLGGSLEIESEPGRGTRVVVTAPLGAEEG